MPNTQEEEPLLLVPQKEVLRDGGAAPLGLLPQVRHQLIHGVGRGVFHSVHVGDADGGEKREKVCSEPQLVWVGGGD